MVTYNLPPSVRRSFDALSAQDKTRVLRMVAQIIDGAQRQPPQFAPGLRVKGLKSAPGVFEARWSRGGRALFRFGDSVRSGEAHVEWLALGGHEILDTYLP